MHATSHRRAHTVRQMRHQVTGFTAIELMVVITILAVLLALAGPSFNPLIDQWRTSQAVNNMTSTFYAARSEAIKRGGRVSVRKIANNTGGCTFAPNNQEWSCGWIIFVDLNNDQNLDAGEEILQTFQMPPNVDVMNLENTASFHLDRWGRANSFGAASFAITPRSTGAASPAATAVCVSAGGRIRTVKESVSC
ncbi:GspH/FimT family pseudopilin [Acidovorax sp.]|uniref:GspH/FimT family pseudopilin n=1 Tax=Acidovorax sp. TaxID=1872122 RepID=UPI00262BFDD1|nr:GspH/FimT family pseudopilin [Acidovorax sp.]